MAYDDHTGILDIERVASDVQAQHYVSCMRWWEVTRSSQGVSCVEPDPSDSNKSRWQMADYWVNLVGDVGRIKIFTLPGSDYSLEKCRHFVIDMAGNAIDAMLQIYETVDDFVMAVKSRRCAPNPKYDLIVKEHHAQEEAFAEKVRRWFPVEVVIFSLF